MATFRSETMKVLSERGFIHQCSDIEALDKQRFKLFTIDENGQPLSTTVRSFVDKNTMLNEIGHITFKRVEQPQQPLF